MCDKLEWVVLGGAMFVIGLLMYRDMHPRKPLDDGRELDFSPVERFLQVNRALAKQDFDTLSRLVDANLVDFLPGVMSDAPYYFNALVAYKVIDLDKRNGVMSVLYTGKDLHDNPPINEVWHYKRHGDAWLLAGVDEGL